MNFNVTDYSDFGLVLTFKSLVCSILVLYQHKIDVLDTG